MTVINIGKKMFLVPQCWNDLSQTQLLKIIEILTNEQDILISDANAKFFKILTEASWLRLLLNKGDVFENIHLVEWIYESQPVKLLTKNLIPTYRNFYGPADEMGNMVALEFFWAQHFYDRWAAHKNDADLNMLVATLYRPAKKRYDLEKNESGDKREEYNPNITELYSKIAATWDPIVKHAIAKWFEHNYLALRNKYPEPFIGGSGEPAKFGFVSLFRDVAERGIHGNFKEVEKMNIHLLFIELSEVLSKDRKIS